MWGSQVWLLGFGWIFDKKMRIFHVFLSWASVDVCRFCSRNWPFFSLFFQNWTSVCFFSDFLRFFLVFRDPLLTFACFAQETGLFFQLLWFFANFLIFILLCWRLHVLLKKLMFFFKFSVFFRFSWPLVDVCRFCSRNWPFFSNSFFFCSRNWPFF